MNLEPTRLVAPFSARHEHTLASAETSSLSQERR